MRKKGVGQPFRTTPGTSDDGIPSDTMRQYSQPGLFDSVRQSAIVLLAGPFLGLRFAAFAI
jgi:hypothetical protein